MVRLHVLIFFFSFNIYSQNIRGTLFDSENKESIPFVNIYIKNTSIGVISNKEGKFQISIPQKYNKDFLVFSAMGFETLEMNISEFEEDIPKTIVLKPSTTVLDEIVLRNNKLTANEIVKKAFDNYYNNFPEKPFIAKGFLRHTEKTKTTYKWLVEAAIEVYDPGFNKSPKKNKTNVIEVRRSLDNRSIDTLNALRWYLEQDKGLSIRKAWKKTPKLSTLPKKELQKAINHHDKYFTLPGWKKSYFYSLFSTDLNKIRYYNQKKATLDNKVFKKFTFKLDTILHYDNEEVFKIKIIPQKKRYKDFGKQFIPFGWLYIRRDNFSILEFNYFTVRIGKYADILNKIFGSKIRSSIKLKYKEIDNKMYLYYMNYSKPKINNISEITTQSPKNEAYYFTKEEIIFTEIITDKQTIDLRLQQPWGDNLFSPHPYHAEFWKNYNILLESKEQQKLIKDLEKKVKLKEQYKQAN